MRKIKSKFIVIGRMNSKQYKYGEAVPIPTYGYFNKSGGRTGTETFRKTLQDNLDKSCTGLSTTGSVVSTSDMTSVKTDKLAKQFLDKNKNGADEITAAMIAGKNNVSITGDKDNQIKYLACQVAQMHAREYDANKFSSGVGVSSIHEIFQKFASMKPYLMIIFFLSIFIFIQGFFGSFDIGYNIATSLFRGESSGDIQYWLGILIGVSIPFVIILSMFGNELCKTMKKLDYYDITNNPYGDNKMNAIGKSYIDYSMVALFVIAIYGFVGILYTIQMMDKKMNWLVLSVVMGSLLMISIAIYVFYTKAPFVVTEGGKQELSKDREFGLYVKKIDDVDEIRSKNTLDENIRKVFVGTILILYVLAMLFFKTNQNRLGEGKWWGSVIRGMTGAGAIMILPILWVLNTALAFNYFYAYPIIIIVVRGIRYFGKMLMYKLLNTDTGSVWREMLSDKFLEEFSDDKMREYSPSWSLLGVSFLKSWMNMCGFENRFSKEIIDTEGYSRNLSQNSYVSSFFILKMLSQREWNQNGVYFSILLIVLTIGIGMSVLYGTKVM